jgi:adenylate cyclase
MFELVFLTGARAGEVVPVTRTMMAGRSPECQLEVPDPNASRKHTQVIFDGTVLSAADNGSANGTFVNDQRLAAAVVLKHGDVLRLGETRLRIQRQRKAGSSSVSVSASSVFGFREQEQDLSHSVVLEMSGSSGGPVTTTADLQARLEAIMEVSTALEKIDKLEEVCRTILDALLKVFPQAERAFLMTGTETGRLVPAAVRLRGREVGTEGLVISTSICRRVLETRSALLFGDQNTGDFDQGMSIVSLKLRSAMTVPMLVGDEVLGLLQIDTTDPARAFTKDDLALAAAASRMAAIALKNAEQLRKIEVETAHRNNLMRFVPGPVADQVLSGSLDIGLGGKTYHSTILFSDIIGFTRLSESLEPAEVVRLMNDYFDRMVPCIEHESGSVDKFIGDAIMAFWGVPFDRGDAVGAAVRAAINMQNALVGLNSQLIADGRPVLRTGIGLNTGAVVAGNIGVGSRMEYTLLGDAVNTASRIEHAAVRGQVLASKATFDALAGFVHGVLMPPLRAKNKAEPLAVYCIRAMSIAGQEAVVHLPVTCGDQDATIVRRLSDGSLIVLHPKDCDICSAPLVSAAPEWTGTTLGQAVMVAVIPAQAADGVLVRSQVTVPDTALGGLLGETPIACTCAWESLIR